MPVLPLLKDAANYRPCIQDLLADGEAVREYWLALFERHVETLAALPQERGRLCDAPRWREFRAAYLDGLARLRREPDLRGRLTVLDLTVFREELFAAMGWGDPFATIKGRENRSAMSEYGAWVAGLDAMPASRRIERIVTGLMAGNLFDLGSKAAVDAFAADGGEFSAALARVRPRPWAIDGVDALNVALSDAGRKGRQILFFVDNAGPDIVLGAIPLARELARRGDRVVLAANTSPSLNDVTAAELAGLLDELRGMDAILDGPLRDDRLAVVPSGCHSPLIDLSQCSEACCAAARESDLVVLEGMGRAIESNFDAAFTVDCVKMAMVKDPMVAELIGVQLFEPVVKVEWQNTD